MKTNFENKNTIASPSALKMLKSRSAENQALQEFCISAEDHKEWLAYREKIDSLLIRFSLHAPNNSLSYV